MSSDRDGDQTPIDLGDAAASLHLGDTTGADFQPPAKADLHPGLLKLSWLLGAWRGHGRGDYPDIDEYSYGQELTFSHHGQPVLDYSSRLWSLDDDHLIASESGFLRPQPDGTVEALFTQSGGVVELAYGTYEGVKLELASDFVARSATGEQVTGVHRLYGLVEGVLLYAIDKSAGGHELQPHQWGRLYRAQA
jgi:THAP4-like, heme-binding beta-barrel domain